MNNFYFKILSSFLGSLHFLNCTVFLSVCQLTQLVQVLPRIHIPQFGIVPGGHKADGTGVGPRNGIAAAAIRQVKQLRKIIRAEQHWAAGGAIGSAQPHNDIGSCRQRQCFHTLLREQRLVPRQKQAAAQSGLFSQQCCQPSRTVSLR